MTEMDMGETRIDAIESQPGEYIAAKEWFSMVGDWAVRISIRRADTDDTEATFIVPVGDSVVLPLI